MTEHMSTVQIACSLAKDSQTPTRNRQAEACVLCQLGNVCTTSSSHGRLQQASALASGLTSGAVSTKWKIYVHLVLQ